MSEHSPELITSLLNQLEVEFNVFVHPPFFSVEDSKGFEDQIPGAHTKNLFLTNKKDRYFLISMHGQDRLDIKILSQSLGAGPLSFASAEELLLYLKMTPGSVTPFSVIFDEIQKVEIIIDERLMSADKIGFHPLINSQTLVLTPMGLEKFFTKSKIPYKVFKIPLK